MSQENSENANQEVKSFEFDAMYLLAQIIRFKYFIIIITGIASIATLFMTLSMPRWYTATVNAIPPKTNSSLLGGAMSGISSTLKEFGLTKLGGQSGDDYSFLVILNSRSVKDSILDKFQLAKEYEIPDSERTKLYNALDENLELSYEKEGNYTISMTSKDKQKAADIANYTIELANSISQRVSRSEAIYNISFIGSRIVATDSALESISIQLQKYSKDKMVFSPLDQAKAISTAYATLKSELIIQETQWSILKNKYGENDQLTQSQKRTVEVLQQRLNDAETKPGFAGNFSLNEATGVGIEYARLFAQFETFTKVRSFLLPMLEEAKIKEKQETPTLMILDKAVPPDKHSKPKKAFIILGATFGAFLLSILFVVLLDGYKRTKAKYLNYKK
jgi:uncharacterized protein involved in exopolysaccharide biosynthesis